MESWCDFSWRQGDRGESTANAAHLAESRPPCAPQPLRTGDFLHTHTWPRGSCPDGAAPRPHLHVRVCRRSARTHPGRAPRARAHSDVSPVCDGARVQTGRWERSLCPPGAAGPPGRRAAGPGQAFRRLVSARKPGFSMKGVHTMARLKGYCRQHLGVELQQKRGLQKALKTRPPSASARQA